MSKQAWICEKCLTPYENEESAKTCEERHEPMGAFKLVGLNFERLDITPTEILVEYTSTMSWMRGQKSILRYRIVEAKR